MQQSPLLSSKTSALLICVLTQDTKSRDIKLLCYASLSFTWGIDFTPHTRKTVTKKKKKERKHDIQSGVDNEVYHSRTSFI